MSGDVASHERPCTATLWVFNVASTGTTLVIPRSRIDSDAFGDFRDKETSVHHLYTGHPVCKYFSWYSCDLFYRDGVFTVEHFKEIKEEKWEICAQLACIIFTSLFLAFLAVWNLDAVIGGRGPCATPAEHGTWTCSVSEACLVTSFYVLLSSGITAAFTVVTLFGSSLDYAYIDEHTFAPFSLSYMLLCVGCVLLPCGSLLSYTGSLLVQTVQLGCTVFAGAVIAYKNVYLLLLTCCN